MMNFKVDLATLFRHIQSLRLAPVGTIEEEEELDFYKTIFSAIVENMEPDSFSSLIPISFTTCPIAKAQRYARPLGLTIVEGSSSAYLSFSKGIEY